MSFAPVLTSCVLGLHPLLLLFDKFYLARKILSFLLSSLCNFDLHHINEFYSLIGDYFWCIDSIGYKSSLSIKYA
jgi:hypothetical protein